MYGGRKVLKFQFNYCTIKSRYKRQKIMLSDKLFSIKNRRKITRKVVEVQRYKNTRTSTT